MRVYTAGTIPSENINIIASQGLKGPHKASATIDMVRDENDNILSLSIAEARDLSMYLLKAINFLERGS